MAAPTGVGVLAADAAGRLGVLAAGGGSEPHAVPKIESAAERKNVAWVREKAMVITLR